MSLGTTTYGWDALNRMTSLNANSYAYRADGMRVAKTVGAVTTRYRYDGQMGMEDSDSTGKVIQYGLGARGIDYMQNPAPSGGYTAFPVYDPHGNMVATFTRNGLGWVVGNQRSFDCWGNVRLGVATGDPTGRYCGNLGHKQDDESGLIYMRARYYEPTSGRFISEDPNENDINWFAYAGNDPVGYADRTGRIKFSLGDYSFRLDYDLRPDGDLHVWQKGKEIIAMWADGTAHHKQVANEWTADLVKTLKAAAAGGDEKAIGLLAKLKKAGGGFGAPQSLLDDIVLPRALDTVTATMEVDPDFVLQLFADIGGFDGVEE